MLKSFFIAVVLAQCVFSAPLKAAESCLINVINPTTYNKILDYLLISRDDVSLYKKIFRAIDAEDFKTADKLVGKLENNIILGHALAEKYLSRGYKASYDELKDWLAKYYDHPQANRIYNLAVRKGGAAGLTKPKKYRRLRLSAAGTIRISKSARRRKRNTSAVRWQSFAKR